MPEPAHADDVERLVARVRALEAEGCPYCTLVGELEAQVAALEAELAEATAIMRPVSERQFALWQAVQRAVSESHRLDDVTRTMRLWLLEHAPGLRD